MTVAPKPRPENSGNVPASVGGGRPCRRTGLDPTIAGSEEAVMPFVDRVEASRRLADRLSHLRDQDVVVLGLPRGGVPVAFEVARSRRWRYRWT